MSQKRQNIWNNDVTLYVIRNLPKNEKVLEKFGVFDRLYRIIIDKKSLLCKKSEVNGAKQQRQYQQQIKKI